MSQSQVDTLLGRQQGTYNRLENGTRVTQALLYEVAGSLGLDHREWVALWRFALGAHPPHAWAGDLGPSVPGAWQLVLDALPMIAYITDQDWNVLAWNDPTAGLFASMGVPDNSLQWMLTDPQARRILLQWETMWAPTLLAQLRAAWALHPESDTLRDLVQIARDDPDAGPLYETSGNLVSVIADAKAPRPIRHPDPEIGEGWVYLCSSDVNGTPGARLVQFPFTAGVSSPSQLPPLDPARS